MNAPAKIKAAPTGLALLREPFADNQISKLPKPTKAQTEAVKADYKKGIRCKLCEAWHHPDVVHLDYVGHAALTDRLLDTDPQWFWEPVAFTEAGLPAFDQTGGLWIKLTVCGVTRLGYGHAAGKQNQDPGAREKEVIGDALRNAAMRFGAALDLWHKGQLHATENDETGDDERAASGMPDDEYNRLTGKMKAAGVTAEKLQEAYKVADLRDLDQAQYAAAIKRLDLTIADKAKASTNEQAKDFGKELLDDEIPY